MDRIYYAVGDFVFGLDPLFFQRLPAPYNFFEKSIDSHGDEKVLNITGEILNETNSKILTDCLRAFREPFLHFYDGESYRVLFYPYRKERPLFSEHKPWGAEINKLNVKLKVPDIDYQNCEFNWQFGRSRLLPRLCSYFFQDKPSYLVHGAAIVGANGAILLTGDSGVGKSTLSKLLRRQGALVISDDLVLIQKRDDGFYVSGTPWNFTNPEMSKNKLAKLEQIFFLSHGSQNVFFRYSEEQGLRLLVRQIHSFNNGNTKKDNIERLLFAKQLLTCSAFSGFAFIPDISAWEAINGTFNL